MSSADQSVARRAWLAGVQWLRDRRAVEDAEAAFDAWWSSSQPVLAQVPEAASSWWHGRWSEGPARLYDHRGPARHRALDTLPLDGGYAPQRHPKDRRPGEFKRTVVASNGDVFTILSWWDPTYADVSASFIVRGDGAYTSDAMIAAFPRHFPGQAIQLAVAGVDLVEGGR